MVPKTHTGQILSIRVFGHKLHGYSTYRHIQSSRATSKSTKKGRFKQKSKNNYSLQSEKFCHAGAHPKVGRHSVQCQRKPEKEKHIKIPLTYLCSFCCITCYNSEAEKVTPRLGQEWCPPHTLIWVLWVKKYVLLTTSYWKHF